VEPTGDVRADAMQVVRDMLGAPTLSIGDVERIASKPAIWFHPSVAQGDRSIFEQCRQLRYRKTNGDPEHKAPSEKFEDINDEGPDVVRYMCQSPQTFWTAGHRASGRDGLQGFIDDVLSDDEYRRSRS